MTRDKQMKVYTGGVPSSPRWAVWRRMVLRRSDGKAYLDRRRLVQTPWFGVYLHRFEAPDPGIDLHDHPWPFVSIVVRGWYVEHRADTRTAQEEQRAVIRTPFRPRRMRLTECHTIVEVPPGTRSIVLVGRRSRDWGFYTSDGYVPHAVYDTNRRDLVWQEDSA